MNFSKNSSDLVGGPFLKWHSQGLQNYWMKGGKHKYSTLKAVQGSKHCICKEIDYETQLVKKCQLSAYDKKDSMTLNMKAIDQYTLVTHYVAPQNTKTLPCLQCICVCKTKASL